jgi:carbonic anhydrase
MSHTLQEADILRPYRDSPVAQLLRWQNLDGPAPAARLAKPSLVLSVCFEHEPVLRLAPGFAITLRTAAGSLKRVPFDVSWALGIAGATAITLVGHEDCGMAGLRQHREAFVDRMVGIAGWEKAAAEQHFDHWSDLFEVAHPADLLLAETRRLRSRYPGLVVAPLLLAADGKLNQVIEGRQ